MRLHRLAPALLLAACTTNAPPPATPGAATVDSLVLERTPCFGFCPTYRLSIARSGAVVFEPTARTAADGVARDSASVPSATLDSLVARAERIGFFGLPELVREDSTLCQALVTDHPSVVLSVHQPSGVHRVDYYTGCYANGGDSRRVAVLDSLGALAAAIDSAANVARWLPADRRP